MKMTDSIRRLVVKTYTMARHPESIALRRKGINYEHYRDLKRQWILDLGIKSIIDIGANEGQFAKLAREVFPSADIYSFEPLPDCFANLKNALPNDENFFPFENGIGSKEQTLDFFRSFHSPSSSFLKMEELYKQAFPESENGQSVEPIKVQVKTLDGVFGERQLSKNILVKIDVQGYEIEAIEGASQVLKESKLAILEMSFIELYEKQPLFHEVYEKMYNLGFRFHGSLAQMLHPTTSEVVQMDAIFVREI